MFRFLFLVIVHCLSAEAASSCENATVGNSRSLYFSGIADLILQGHGYRNLTGVSKIRCGNLCLSNTRCFSFNYSDRDKLCELNGASASQFPQALAEKKDTYYYGPEKPSVIKQLQLPVSDKGGNSRTLYVQSCTGETKVDLGRLKGVNTASVGGSSV